VNLIYKKEGDTMFELKKLNDTEVKEMLLKAPRRPGVVSEDMEKLRGFLKGMKVGETFSYPKGDVLPKGDKKDKDRYKNVVDMEAAVKYMNDTYASKKGTRFLNFRDTDGRYAVIYLSAQEVQENTIEVEVKTNRKNLKIGDKVKKFDSEGWRKKRVSK
jgi:hypothetical protein